MQSDAPELFKLNSLSPAQRPRLRLIEWLIAVMFIVTLLFASGVFIRVSNAADSRVQMHAASNSIAPGTIGTMSHNTVMAMKETSMSKPRLASSLDDTSCELKP
ncbi:hypothetical protein [Kaarinaea lacus]